MKLQLEIDLWGEYSDYKLPIELEYPYRDMQFYLNIDGVKLYTIADLDCLINTLKLVRESLPAKQEEGSE